MGFLPTRPGRLCRRAAALPVICLAAVFLLANAEARAEPGFVGMQIQDMPPEVFEALGEDKAFGLLIRDVGLGTPAADAGFLRGDILTAIDGNSLASIKQVIDVLKSRRPGDTVDFELLRKRAPMTLTLTLGAWPKQWRHGKSGFANIPTLGITLSTVNDDIREQLGVRWGSNGVVVTIVEEGKESITGLRRGDVILQVNQDPVWLPKQVLERYQSAKADGKKHLLIFVERLTGYEYRLLPIQ